jgi:hypothetical protein
MAMLIAWQTVNAVRRPQSRRHRVRAAFHVGQNLRRDRIIRARLRSAMPPWRVEELRAADLGLAIVDRLMRD